ncbi:MAG: hypothetical protein E7157_01130 [Lactobacillales bacterium]|nr:hypothetical protein [Lactobacillales bacterium]
MKEAAGEANMTVITIVLIAIVLGVGTIIVNNLMDSVKNNSESMNHGCASDEYWTGSACAKRTGTTSGT